MEKYTDLQKHPTPNGVVGDEKKVPKRRAIHFFSQREKTRGFFSQPRFNIHTSRVLPKSNMLQNFYDNTTSIRQIVISMEEYIS